MRVLALFFFVVALPVLAGGRGHVGGALSVCVVAKAVESDPLLADSPTDVAALFLTRTPLCRLVETSHPSPQVTRLTPLPGVQAASVAAALKQVLGSVTAVRSLLAGVKSVSEVKGAVEVVGASVELDRVLCHPAFAMAPGPFKSGKDGQLLAATELPDGRPYVDSVTVTAVDARTAERLLAQHKAQLVLGATQPDDAAQLFLLSLVYSPSLGAHLRQALEASIDRADLVRFFVKAPSAPLPTLLPPSLSAPAGPPGSRPAKPAPLSPAKEVTLLYDASVDDERAIAERLQVKLQPNGYRVALKGLPRAELRAHHPADTELMLVNTLVPPTPAAALAMLFDVAGQRQRLATLPGDDAKAQKLALEVLPELPLWPLATHGLGVTTSREVQHLTRDTLGLPRLDDVFLSAE
jgi:hypothetical protein